MTTKGYVQHKESFEHAEESFRKLDDLADAQVNDWSRLKKDANDATEDEHNTSFYDAITKRHRKAVFWSVVISLAIIMDGYDTALIGSFFGFPAFQKKYGHEVDDSGTYQLHAKWQSALGLGNPIGNVVGVWLNGYLTERYGHKMVLNAGLLCLTAFIFIQFFAPTVDVLFAGQLLCGIPWGLFSVLAPSYASEVAPMVLRSYLETWVVVCWGIGQFLSYAALFTLNKWDSHWAFKIPFGIQWVWPVIIVPLALFCPESPWWLVRHGRYVKAEQSLMRLTSAPTKELQRHHVKKALALMIETNQLEQDISQSTSYTACFRGTDLWRTEIAAVSWGIQILTGFVIQGYSAYFFQQAGLSHNDSFKMTLGIGAIHLVSNFGSAALTGNYGRRRLFLCGCVALAILMFVIGGLAFGPQNTAFGFATSAVYCLWFAVWCFSIGPLPYIINGEVSATRLRSKTMSLARGTYVILGIINSAISPYVLNPENGNWRGKTGLLTGALTVVSLAWAYFRLPETGGRTYEELDILFAEPKMTARKFSLAEIHRDGDVIRVTGPHLRGN